MLAQVGFNGGRLVISLFAIHLQATPATVGLLIGLMGVGPMLQSILLGRWVDRVGAVKPLALGLAALLCGIVLPALYPSIVTIGLACVFIGSGFMLSHMTISNAIGHAVAPDQRTTAFGHLAVGSSVASTTGPLLSGYLIDAQGHSSTLLILAIFTLAGLGLLAFKGHAVRPKAKLAATSPLTNHKPRLLDLLRNADLRAVLIVSGLSTMSWDLYSFIMPLHGSALGLSATTIGVVMGSFGIAALLARLATPYVARRITSWKIMASTLAVSALVYALLPLTSAVLWMVTLSLIVGFGLGFAQPMVMTLIYVMSPPGRTGEVVGVRTTLINASQTMLPWSAGAVGSAIGLASMFWLAAPALGLGAWYAIRRSQAPTS